MEYIMLLIW